MAQVLEIVEQAEETLEHVSGPGAETCSEAP
jgi:hypothetical protein